MWLPLRSPRMYSSTTWARPPPARRLCSSPAFPTRRLSRRTRPSGNSRCCLLRGMRLLVGTPLPRLLPTTFARRASRTPPRTPAPWPSSSRRRRRPRERRTRRRERRPRRAHRPGCLRRRCLLTQTRPTWRTRNRGTLEQDRAEGRGVAPRRAMWLSLSFERWHAWCHADSLPGSTGSGSNGAPDGEPPGPLSSVRLDRQVGGDLDRHIGQGDRQLV
mmetsp:Transcript_8266/g.19281  ORF Transcript_8266/g.19281 Transcript_8266/m.19281 type:complete len:217 (+) Transcript_8266:739-1389(+)